MSEVNKELVRRWVGIFNAQDVEADDVVAGVYVEHATAPFGRSAPGAVDGPQHLRDTAKWLRDQFPDLQFTIQSSVADGDTVACRIVSSGTNLGPLNGILPPTGKRFEAEQSHWFRVKEGKLAEHWATRDDLAAMIQLGVITAPGPPARAR